MQQLAALTGLLVSGPLLAVFVVLIYLQDRRFPLYISSRVGKDRQLFKMYKLRSMTIDASNYGINSTSESDPRITKVGRIVRKTKIDEFMQLINVLKGDMALVGPRPNVIEEVKNYTDDELLLLSIKPGITDFSSIVFSDESQILKDSTDPDRDYNKLIWPMKSRLGLFYVQKRSPMIDLQILLLTVLNVFSRRIALIHLSRLLRRLGSSPDIYTFARRDFQLEVSD